MMESLCHEPFLPERDLGRRFKGVYVGWVASAGVLCRRDAATQRARGRHADFFRRGVSRTGTFATLKQRGHAVEAHGPSYLVHRYEEEPDFPKGLNGRFHGLVADRARETATLFNDRFGLQRLYYHEAKDAFYFAAEAKAILKVRPELRGTDPRGLGEFIVCGCVLENRTLFPGIYVLPPGAAWVFVTER